MLIVLFLSMKRDMRRLMRSIAPPAPPDPDRLYMPSGALALMLPPPLYDPELGAMPTMELPPPYTDREQLLPVPSLPPAVTTAGSQDISGLPAYSSHDDLPSYAAATATAAAAATALTEATNTPKHEKPATQSWENTPQHNETKDEQNEENV